MTRPGLSLEERFWLKVQKGPGCWEWTAAKDRDGYGQIGKGGGMPGNMLRAHRVSYELAKGPIAAGLDIDHACGNRGCVNPAHLNAVSHKQNMENRKRTTSATGLRGVYNYSNSGKFIVKVGHHGKQHIVGVFADIEEAEAAAIAKRNELHTNNLRDRSAA